MNNKSDGGLRGGGMGDCKQDSNIYIKLFSFGKTEARLSMLHNHRENGLNVWLRGGLHLATTCIAMRKRPKKQKKKKKLYIYLLAIRFFLLQPILIYV